MTQDECWNLFDLKNISNLLLINHITFKIKIMLYTENLFHWRLCIFFLFFITIGVSLLWQIIILISSFLEDPLLDSIISEFKVSRHWYSHIFGLMRTCEFYRYHIGNVTFRLVGSLSFFMLQWVQGVYNKMSLQLAKLFLSSWYDMYF